MKDTLEQTRQEKENGRQQLAALQAKNQQLAEQIEALIQRNEALRAPIRELETRYHQLLSEYDVFRNNQAEKEARLKAKYDEMTRKYKALLKNYEAVHIRQNALTLERDKLEKEGTEFQKIINKIKGILKGQGLTDILAEVEKMEREKKEAERKAGSDGGSGGGSGGEDIYNDFKLWVQFYPDGELLDAQLWEGKANVQDYYRLTVEDLIDLAKYLNEEYTYIAESYTDEEKEKHRPRVLLKIHPNTPYGQLQQFLKRIRPFIPVSIVPWDQ